MLKGSVVEKLYIVGGQAKSNFQELGEFHGYERALVLEVVAETGHVRELTSWKSPAGTCPANDPSFVFKSGTLTSDRLWVCTQTEVLSYSIPDFQVRDYISLPFFTDLHHVTPTARGTLLVALPGLDMVAEISAAGDLLHAWDVLGNTPWTRFSRETDYRLIPTTKPHLSHPNFVFGFGNSIWVTRHEQKDAVSLKERSPGRIPIESGLPHDGHVRGDRVFFTTVNGSITISNCTTCQVEQVIDLQEILKPPRSRPLGWCRGLKHL